jgi:hypothetical protein
VIERRVTWATQNSQKAGPEMDPMGIANRIEKIEMEFDKTAENGTNN